MIIVGLQVVLVVWMFYHMNTLHWFPRVPRACCLLAAGGTSAFQCCYKCPPPSRLAERVPEARNGDSRQVKTQAQFLGQVHSVPCMDLGPPPWQGGRLGQGELRVLNYCSLANHLLCHSPCAHAKSSSLLQTDHGVGRGAAWGGRGGPRGCAGAMQPGSTTCPLIEHSRLWFA